MNNLLKCKRWLAFSITILSACTPVEHQRDDQILTVAVTAGYHNTDSELHNRLIELFNQRYPQTLRIKPVPHDQLYSALLRNEADIVAAPLRQLQNTTNIKFAPAYMTVDELLVCHKKATPERVDEQPELLVLSQSSQEYALKEARQTLYPGLHWKPRRQTTVQDLLTEVSEREALCAVANERQFAESRIYHTNLERIETVASPSRLAWAYRAGLNQDAISQVHHFFYTIEQDGTLEQLLERYYGFHNRLSIIDTAAFIQRSEARLPKFEPLFKQAEKETGIDWRLLAALSYQESHWDPEATSFSHVRGLMMLTLPTARQMNVTNRLDPEQSIMGGARYLNLLKGRLPDRIAEPDRTWLAMAAYNQGLSHLESARVLTQRAGLDPDSWADVKRKMPLLSNPRYYRTVRYGYARGGEAVILVENVRNFYKILKRLRPEPLSFVERFPDEIEHHEPKPQPVTDSAASPPR